MPKGVKVRKCDTRGCHRRGTREIELRWHCRKHFVELRQMPLFPKDKTA